MGASKIAQVYPRYVYIHAEREDVLNNVLEGLQQSAIPLLDDELFILFSREVIVPHPNLGQQRRRV